MIKPSAMSAIGTRCTPFAGTALVAALALWFALPARADHIPAETYPYSSEITISLRAQEKFYVVDPEQPDLFREATTTRLAAYKVWGTGLLSTQNDPDDDDPHGPLKDMGLLLHEMGTNRDGMSTLRLLPGESPPRLRMEQDTVLVTRAGDRIPDVRLAIDVALAPSASTDTARLHLRPTEAGRKDFEDGIRRMVREIAILRRKEIDAELATNGLRLLEGTQTLEVSFPGNRELRAIIDTDLGAARVTLPDMLIRLSARIEQTYAEQNTEARD